MMIDWTTLINFAMAMVGTVLSSLGLVTAVICRPIERRTRSYFITNFIITLICTSAMVVDYYAIIYHHVTLIKPMIFVESLTSSLLMPMLTAYMLRLCGESWRKKTLFITVIVLWAVYFFLLIYTQFSTIIYSVSEDGVYRRGPLYPMLLIPPAVIMLLNLIGLFRRRKIITVKQRHAMFIYIAAPLLGMILQMFFYGLLLVAFSAIVGAYMMFVFILSEQTDMAIRHVRENAEKEFGMKVLQMRPHFIYNVMTSIYYLVDTDPLVAKNAIRDFSKYLHQNFSAVVKTENIPFTEELAHTQAYLAVEKTRFGDRLDVTYDTGNDIFSLPPLTLEPIVENAVKHGMNPECDPLHIVIRTRAVEGGHEITVLNDGAEFKPSESAPDGVSLKNVSERLEMMCGGSLHIMPRDGGGAVVTLWIPEE